MTETIIDGTRFYIINGRQYIADLYDKMMKPAHGIKMKKNKFYKGENHSSKVLADNKRNY